MSALDLVDWPAGRTLALSGLARDLRIPIILRNDSADAVPIDGASLAEVRLQKTGAPLRLAPVPFQLSVAPNGATQAQIRLRLDRSTPPGRYQGEIRLGPLARPIEIEIVEEARLSIRPSPLVVDASLGPAQRFTLAVENSGNVSLNIDLTGRYPIGEEALFLSGAGAPAVDGVEQLGRLVNRALGVEPAPVLTEVGSADLAMADGPLRLEPGGSGSVQIVLTLPEGLAATARYHVFAPLYAADLHIVVVTASKTAPRGKDAVSGKSAGRGKGAAK